MESEKEAANDTKNGIKPKTISTDDHDQDQYHIDHDHDYDHNQQTEQLPQDQDNQDDYDDGLGHVLDLEESLKQQRDWPSVTAKRGSGQSITCSSSAPSNYVGDILGIEKREHDAAVNLMVLAREKPNARAELASIIQQIENEKAKKEEVKEEEKNSGDEENNTRQSRKQMKLGDQEEEEGQGSMGKENIKIGSDDVDDDSSQSKDETSSASTEDKDDDNDGGDHVSAQKSASNY